MNARWGLGPVFFYECVTSARRWQLYAGRAVLIFALLTGMALIARSRFRSFEVHSIREIASIGSTFFETIMSVELVLALLLVPAAAAGVICQDKMRGGLTLMMVTDLSNAEIVFGKLASRVLAVLGVVACGLPVLALATFMGGVDPVDTWDGSMVIVGVAVLGVSVSLTYSVWATKPHEALMATYATWAVWLLSLLTWTEIRPGSAPDVLYVSNPFWLIFGGRWSTPAAAGRIENSALFLLGSLVVSAVLALVVTWRVRAVTLRPARIGARAGRSQQFLERLTDRRWREQLLERYPVVWRELRRGRRSNSVRAIWTLYAVLSTVFTVLAAFEDSIALGVGGFMVSVGLLMVSVTSATALAEERSHGHLDVLLTTPLSSWTILWGKWCGAFRPVPLLAILPGILTFAVAARRHLLILPAATVINVLLVLAYGAALASFGILSATWHRQLGRAIGLSVIGYLLVTVIVPTILIVNNHGNGPFGNEWLWVSPFFAMYNSLGLMTWLSPRGFGVFWTGATLAIGLYSTLACVLFGLALVTFDRALGRVSDRRARPRLTPRQKPLQSRRDRELSLED